VLTNSPTGANIQSEREKKGAKPMVAIFTVLYAAAMVWVVLDSVKG